MGQHRFQHLHHKALFLLGQLADALDAALQLRHGTTLAVSGVVDRAEQFIHRHGQQLRHHRHGRRWNAPPPDLVSLNSLLGYAQRLGKLCLEDVAGLAHEAGGRCV